MRPALLLSWVVLSAFGAPLHAQPDEPLDAGPVTEVLTRVFAAREVVQDSARIAACSLGPALGGAEASRSQFPAGIRARFVGSVATLCTAEAQQPTGPYPLWRLRRIDVETGFKVMVRAAVVSRSRYHHEAYVVRRDTEPGPGRWYVDEISLSEFVHADPPPPPPQ